MSRVEYTQEVETDWARLAPDVDSSAVGLMQRLIWAGRLMEGLLDRSAIAAGLRKRGDYEVLVAARRAEPALRTAVDLATQLLTSPSGMTSKLDRLERDDLIERKADPTDRRVVRVLLTEKGRVTVDEAFRISISIYEKALLRLTDEDRLALDAALVSVLERLDVLAGMKEPWRA